MRGSAGRKGPAPPPAGRGVRVLLARFARWLLTLVGGILIGAGLVLHGQVALAHYMREEVANTFFLWRAVGEATIFLQGGDIRMAFAMREVPIEVLRETDLAAWTLVAVGALLAIAGPLLPLPHGARGVSA
ncbi:MAG: hypothetical protein AB7O97_13590 [Planctomycetota bacterium]